MPDLEAQETAPLLVPPPLAKRKSTGRSPEEAHSAWWNLTLGAIGLTLLFAIASGLYASFAPGPSKPSDTPDFTKLPGPQPGLRNPNYLRTGYNGAVASEVDLCSEVGVQGTLVDEHDRATDAGSVARGRDRYGRRDRHDPLHRHDQHVLERYWRVRSLSDDRSF